MREIRLVIAGGMLLVTPCVLQAQARTSVTATVSGSDSVPITRARVHLTGAGFDTTIVVNSRGQAMVLVRPGRAHIQVTALGFSPLDRDVEITGATALIALVMHQRAQQLAGRDVKDQWIGIRGAIGDDSTKLPISGAKVTASRRKQSVVTDSTGHFEFPLPRAEETVLRIERAGYVTLLRSIPMQENRPADVVLMLKPGEDDRRINFALRDLQSRVAVGPYRSFIVSGTFLERNGEGNLMDGLETSGKLHEVGIKFGEKICVFIDGEPRPNWPLTAINLADVEFVEVYPMKKEITGTLRFAWGHEGGGPCTTNPDIPVFTGRTARPDNNTVEFVSVWLKKR